MLPIVLQHRCQPSTAHADIVLLIDTSDSMAGDKLAAARSAAATFVGYLDLGRDQAAVVGFNRQPVVASQLSGDRSRLVQAIQGLASTRGTYIDLALQAAAQELVSPRHIVANRRVIVLLSDGAQNGPAADVLRAAADAKAIGAIIYAIGLGTDADRTLLADVADPGRYYFAPTSDQLAVIYRQIAVTIPCP
jgi:Mg-chelatase subunit ChlD